jgi:hypothetical protein
MPTADMILALRERVLLSCLALSFVLALGLGSKWAAELMWKKHFHHQREERDQKADKPDGGRFSAKGWLATEGLFKAKWPQT